MRSSLFFLAATLASATASFVYPDFVPLYRRQAPGTPAYDCHANCGGVISLARTPDYCQNSTFTESLDACLDCALEFDIWRIYGNSVTAAATGCGLEAVPVAANATNATTTANSTASASATTAAASTASDATATATESLTDATGSAAVATTTPDASNTAAQTTTASASATPAQNTGAAQKNVLAGGMAMVPIGALLVGWI